MLIPTPTSSPSPAYSSSSISSLSIPNPLRPLPRKTPPPLYRQILQRQEARAQGLPFCHDCYCCYNYYTLFISISTSSKTSSYFKKFSQWFSPSFRLNSLFEILIFCSTPGYWWLTFWTLVDTLGQDHLKGKLALSWRWWRIGLTWSAMGLNIFYLVLNLAKAPEFTRWENLLSRVCFSSSDHFSRFFLRGTARIAGVCIQKKGLGEKLSSKECFQPACVWSRNSKKSGMAPPVLSIALPSETGRVLSIQSHTVQGYVGNKSAVFPLQLMGYDVDPINSVQFSNHTGYPSFKGQVLNGEQLWDLIEGLQANNLLYYTHLLTGYIGSVSFLNTVLKVVEKLRSINPELTYVCDPVMGDEGKLYVPLELVAVYREKVVPVASMLTPNQFEAEKLTGFRIVSEQDGREACNILHAAGPSKVVITSINLNGNLLLIGSHQKEKGKPPAQFKIAIPKIPAYFTGTGDLMTALLLGWSNKYPDNLDKAAELAVSSLQALLLRTLNDYKRAGYDCQESSLEIRLIQSQNDIRNPEVKYQAERYN